MTLEEAFRECDEESAFLIMNTRVFQHEADPDEFAGVLGYYEGVAEMARGDGADIANDTVIFLKSGPRTNGRIAQAIAYSIARYELECS